MAGRLTCVSSDLWIQGIAFCQDPLHATPKICFIDGSISICSEHRWSWLRWKDAFQCRWWIWRLRGRKDPPLLASAKLKQLSRVLCSQWFHSSHHRNLGQCCLSKSKRGQSLWLSDYIRSPAPNFPTWDPCGKPQLGALRLLPRWANEHSIARLEPVGNQIAKYRGKGPRFAWTRIRYKE